MHAEKIKFPKSLEVEKDDERNILDLSGNYVAVVNPPMTGELVRRWNSHDSLTKQRDALLEACKAIRDASVDVLQGGSMYSKDFKEASHQVEAAIKLTEEA